VIEPTRLLHDANAPEEAASLLRSLSAPEAPSAAKQAQLAQQLASLATPAAAATAGMALWVKAALLLGVLGIAGTWAALKLQAPGPSSPPTALAPSAASVAAPAPPASEAAPAPDAPPAAAQSSAPPDSPREAPVGSARPKASSRDSLAEEEALLEQARRVVGSSPSQALALLQQYQRRFPSGQLSAERMFLSVDVLRRLGNQAAARKQADALIRAFPTSVYASQVKAQSSNP
jgi:hypothetical protein